MNFVLLFDGTGKRVTDIAPSNATNICRLANACENDNIRQRVLAFDGAGTVNVVTGRLFGADCLKILVNAYTELAKAYELKRRNWFENRLRKESANMHVKRVSERLLEKLQTPVKIYVFGFSRGAYIASLVADLVSTCGIARDGKIAEAVVRLRRNGTHEDDPVWARMRSDGVLSKPIPVEYLGLWDRVSATLRRGRWPNYHCLPRGVKFCRHAVAAHEYRACFPLDEIFADGCLDSQRIQTRLFPGSHSDVGGGYSDSHGIADFTLGWIANEAIGRGLLVCGSGLDGGRFSEEFDLENAMVHDSMRDCDIPESWQGVLRFLHRRHRPLKKYILNRRRLHKIPRHEVMDFGSRIIRQRLINKDREEFYFFD